MQVEVPRLGPANCHFQTHYFTIIWVLLLRINQSFTNYVFVYFLVKCKIRQFCSYDLRPKTFVIKLELDIVKTHLYAKNEVSSLFCYSPK